MGIAIANRKNRCDFGALRRRATAVAKPKKSHDPFQAFVSNTSCYD